MNKTEWQIANEWERDWWGDCSNTFNEEQKQYIYAHYMGLDEYKTNWYGRIGWDFGSKSVIDFGGGPCSMLLKSKAKNRTVFDPCIFPEWVQQRYEQSGINFVNTKAETLPEWSIRWTISIKSDECLLYNVLQHVENPELVITNARKIAKIIRIFEWIDTGISEGHLHNLKEDNLNEWLGGIGKVEDINQYPVVGKAYFGIFKDNG